MDSNFFYLFSTGFLPISILLFHTLHTNPVYFPGERIVKYLSKHYFHCLPKKHAMTMAIGQTVQVKAGQRDEETGASLAG
jgi:hypothetical protein